MSKKQSESNETAASKALPSSSGSAPEVLESSARKWDDGGSRECCALLLENGEWVLTWLREAGEAKVQTTVKLSPIAALATMSAIHSVTEKTGKPIGWEPKQNNRSTRGE